MKFKIDRITKDYFLFWNTPCSQWFIHPNKKYLFKDENGIEFYSAEHYMMYHKALIFNDIEIANMILKDPSPRNVKRYGRMVKGYVDEIWNEKRYEIVLKGNLLKFSQNIDIFTFINQYNHLEFVEASPEDKIWGIGLHFDNDDCLDKTKWNGLNLLGKVINETLNRLNTKKGSK